MAPRPLVLLIDGQCPFGGREAALLKRLDRQRGQLRIVDISTPSFAPATYGKTIDQLRERVHAQTPEGEVITGLDAVHHAYAAVGWGFVYAPARWPVIRPIADWLYLVYVDNRPLLRSWFDPSLGDRRAVRNGSRSGPM